MMKSFTEFLSEKAFSYQETKYLPAFIEVIKQGRPLRLGDKGRKGEVVIAYDSNVQALERGRVDIKDVQFRGTDGKSYRFTEFFKGDFSGHSKSSNSGSERQELGLIQAIKMITHQFKDVYIPSISKSERIVDAYKKEGQNSLGKEPYIDIYVETERNRYGVSCKGKSAPSLAGGGLMGIDAVVPDLLPMAFQSVQREIESMGIYHGDEINVSDIPDLFFKIPKNYVKDILVGNQKIGGPIDYIYIGDMTVEHDYRNGELKFNGEFYSIDEFMKKIPEFYIRFRKRDIPSNGKLIVDFENKSRSGHPVIFKSRRKSSHLRVVVTDSTPKSGILLNR